MREGRTSDQMDRGVDPCPIGVAVIGIIGGVARQSVALGLGVAGIIGGVTRQSVINCGSGSPSSPEF